MAGTDRTRTAPLRGGPAVILVEPQLGENVGACARAMRNFGLADLRIVRPRDGWPNDKAAAAASGADDVLDSARLFDSAAAAAADLAFVLAATARPRDMAKDVLSPRQAARRMRSLAAAGSRPGVLFGGERAGLANDEVALADAILAVPADPAFASLNLAQAVVVAAYEWFVGDDAEPVGRGRDDPPATRGELLGFFGHLEAELDAGGFLKPVEKRPRMVRNLRNLFHRAGLSGQEVRTLRGVIVALTGRRKV